MYHALTAVFVLFGLVLALAFIFNIERARGVRAFRFAREHLDYWFLKIEHTLMKTLRTMSRDVLRQIAHYFFHTLLRGLLVFLTNLEHKVKHLMRSNRTLARKSEKENATRNKLEEVALHKMEVALTEEEKRRHREKSLHG